MQTKKSRKVLAKILLHIKLKYPSEVNLLLPIWCILLTIVEYNGCFPYKIYSTKAYLQQIAGFWWEKVISVIKPWDLSCTWDKRHQRTITLALSTSPDLWLCSIGSSSVNVISIIQKESQLSIKKINIRTMMDNSVCSRVGRNTRFSSMHLDCLLNGYGKNQLSIISK